jgi:hypothetical protein
MKFKEFNRYRHIDTLDIDIIPIINILDINEKEVSMRVKYYNRRLHIIQGDIESVKIKKTDYSKWKEIK